MKNILVATDGSENSKKALKQARILAEHMGSKVTIINIAADLPAYIRGKLVESFQEYAIKYQNEVLENALKIFQDYSGEVNLVREKGNEGEAIIKEAEKGDYDLIIMGSRGMGAFFRAILGSTSNKVLNNVRTNVLIVK